jgi:7-cyano-7-deazaguanine synthase
MHGRTVHRDISNVDNAVLGEPTIGSTPGCQVILGNTRAEPTTEFVKHKHEFDQQPYGEQGWVAVHNGTIANDKKLRMLSEGLLPTEYLLSTKIDSAAIVETLEVFSRENRRGNWSAFTHSIRQLAGSYAILASNNYDTIFVAANYRPIWYITTAFGVFFASTRDAFPNGYVPKMVQPYTMMMFSVDGSGELEVNMELIKPEWPLNNKALVVCSGGLDSVVSAVYAQKVLGYEVELIHFVYGSRAQAPEVEAIEAIASHMGVKLHFKAIPSVWDEEDSNLLNPKSTIAGGEAGAEFAHEWVPARNLVMLAIATAFAEAKGFGHIVLGNNLEEAGAYPDNEPEFIDKFNDLLPFAVGDGKKVRVSMPVGNMMKHEIVKLGHDIGAPLHLTWSCYKAGKMHCGTCGPCFMRRTAFQINNLPEVIKYEA